ncbi:DUF3500 domain-containing protein [Planosporangium flavigriseum]
MSAAAVAFLSSLTAEQRENGQRPFPSDDERRRWFYTPTDHGGVALGDLRPAQQQLALRLVATGLSRAGYVAVSTIMGLENILDEIEGWSVHWGRERGRDPGKYWLRLFGDPADGHAWSWRFGGHHVSLNYTVVAGQVVSVTPCFFGADPASSPLPGAGSLRPLAAEEDLARDLVRTLDERQMADTLLTTVAPVDIAGANRPAVGPGDEPLPLKDVWRIRFEGPLAQIVESMQDQAERRAGLTAEARDAVTLSAAPKGIPAAQLGDSQRHLLRNVLDVYLHRIPDGLAEKYASRFRGERLDDVAFAWAGGVEPSDPHYYRIQGPRLLIEYVNTQRGANHVHSVWRDPEGDFGGRP